MKKFIFAIAFIISLFFHSSAIQNRLFRYYIQSGDSFLLAKKIIGIVMKLKKQKKYIEIIRRNLQLEDDEKKILISILWRTSNYYKKAWKEIENIPSGKKLVDELKVKNLYDLRDVDRIIEISKEVEVEMYLNKNQKDTIIQYAFRKKGPTIAKALCEIFSRNDHTNYYSNKAKKFIEKEYNFKKWEQTINKNADTLFTKNNKEEIVKWMEILFELPEEELESALILLIQRAEKNEFAYEIIIEQISKWVEKGQLTLDITNPNWKLLSIADYSMEKGKYKLAYNLLIKAYKDGERSKLLYKLLLKSLYHINLRGKEIDDLQILVDDGFINLIDKKVSYLLGKSKNFYQLYSNITFQNIDIESLTFLLKNSDNLENSIKVNIYKNIVNVLYDFPEKLPLNSEILDILNQNLYGIYKYECIKGRWYIETNQLDVLYRYIQNYCEKNKLSILLYLAKISFEKNILDLALMLANDAYRLTPDNLMVLRRLIGIHNRLGNISQRLQFLNELKSLSGKLIEREYDIAVDEFKLLKEKWTWETDLPPVQLGDQIVHVLNKSLPDVNGYTIRSKEIVQHEKAMGLKPIVVTKLGWPQKKKLNNGEYETHNDIRYYRLYADDPRIQLNMVPMSEYFDHYAEKFANLLINLKPRLVHAASNFQNALPALMVAKKLGVPTIYEVRGLWHDTTASKIPGFDYSERYQLHELYEVYCCQIADKVVAIGDSLADHLVNLGVEKSKISIVPNGVDTKVFVPQPPDKKIIDKYNLNGKTVYGFIGSVTIYEGLDYLFQALAKLRKVKKEIKFLLIGDGPALPGLKQLAKELELEDIVEFVGRVPHEEVKDYYSVIDIFPFPRIHSKVCELVTPLKPYEVMGMGKLALVSDIPALNEMVIDGVTGLVFKSENADSLYHCLIKALDNLHLGIQGRKWVEKNRDWNILIERYRIIYDMEKILCKSH